MVEAARSAVMTASGRCTTCGQAMDLARYELLVWLDTALGERLQVASGNLQQASRERADKASENVTAKRYREHVSEHLDRLRLALAHEQAAKAQEEGVELWLESRKEYA